MFKSILGQVKIVCGALVVLLFSALAVSNLHAQVNTAVLTGTVMDTTGAVVAGAQIQATDVGTGISYAGTTDGAGRYTLPEMPIGTYNVAAQKTGFQKLVQTGVILTVGAHPVLDFTLKVGHTSEVVEVHGQATTVDTTTATVGQLISPAQMSDLPLNGRNFTDLLSLAPGVGLVTPGATGGGVSPTAYGLENNYSVSGSRPVGTSYVIDDLESVDAGDHGTGVGIIGTSLGMEAVQEFTVLTNTYGAQFGGTGAAINMVTKSGTNALHGSAYEYIRNDKLDAYNWFDVAGYKPAYRRNQFGGSLGGPIKKDKAFYFINYEGLRSLTGATVRAGVPDDLTNSEDPNNLYVLYGYTPGGTTGWTCTNPTLCGPYGVGVPMNALSESIMATYPAAQSATQCPNVTHELLYPGTGLYCSVGNNAQNEDYGVARVDSNFGAKDSAFARYTIENADQIVPYVESELPGWPEVDHERNQYMSIEERHVFSPALLNEARFGFVRLNEQTVGGGFNGGGPLDMNNGIQDADWAPGDGLTPLGPPPSSPSLGVTNRFSVGDDVVLTKGAHSLHMGILFTKVQSNTLAVGYGGGWADFIGLDGDAEFGYLGGALQGSPFIEFASPAATYTYTTPSGTSYPWTPRRYWRQNWLAPYIQDDWKISKRLTVNLGVRYDWASNPTTKGLPVFVLPNGFPLTATESSFVTASHPFTSNPNMNNIDPRVGVAYDPFGDHKTSIRAGFGLFHEPIKARTFASSFNPVSPLYDITFPTIYGVYPSLPTSLAQMSASFFGPAPTDNVTWFGAILNNVDHAPYVMQYNLTVQRQLPKGMLFNIGYNGSSGVHEFSQIDANLPTPLSALSSSAQATAIASGDYAFPTGGEPTATGAPGTLNNPFVGTHLNPNFAAVDADEPIAHSTYNSLQTSLARQFVQGLAGTVSYTWSKCLDDGSATTSLEQGEWAVYDAYNPKLDRGPCSYNSPQVFSANAIYSLPFHGNRAVNGWQVSPIFSRFVGLPMNIQNMLFFYQSNIGGSVEGERPSKVPGCNPLVKKVHSEWFNQECFVEMPFGTIGTAGRDSVPNPDFFNWDFSVMKNTKITERVSAQLRAEFFDILNHPNFNLGQQQYLLSTTATLNAVSNPNYSQLANPAAYELPTASSAGGAICNPSGVVNAPVPANGLCYVGSTAAGGTYPGAYGGNREIQFALKLIF
jgi:hypothetical protein